jgi:serine/threonine protein kinase
MLFLAMRFVDGVDLEHVVDRDGPLWPGRAAHATAQVASALGAAHAAGLVHRDVKPANILLAANDHAYLTDFGLSKRLLAELDQTETGTGQLLGTLDYVTPEQIRGKPVGPYTDIYALGCVLFHSLTGRVPFPMQEREAKLWAHLSSPPPPLGPGVPDAFDEVVARAMAKEPEDRYASAEDLAAAATSAAARTSDRDRAPLRPVARNAPAPQASLDRREQRWPWIRHALLAPFSLAILAFVLAGGLVFGRPAVAVPVALAVYAIAAAVIYFDRDERRKISDRELARRRARGGSAVGTP